MDNNEQVEKYYTTAEVSVIFANMDQASLIKLYKIASSLEMIFLYNAEELVHDAIVKLLSGDRQLPKDQNIFVAFKMICFSLLTHYIEKESNKQNDSLDETDENGSAPISNLSSHYISPEQELIIGDIRSNIYVLFEDDPLAKELIDGRMDGITKSDLMAILEISDKEYETKWKKIRRRMLLNYKGSMV